MKIELSKVIKYLEDRINNLEKESAEFEKISTNKRKVKYKIMSSNYDISIYELELALEHFKEMNDNAKN